MSDKVLYVDDDAASREWFARAASPRFEVALARDGDEALERFERDGPFAVVVSDYRLTGASGAEVLARVRERSRETVTMLLTGYGDYEVAAESLHAAHVARVLEKPCPRGLLLTALEDGIEEHRSRAAARSRAQRSDFACEVLADFNRELDSRLAQGRAEVERAVRLSAEAEARANAAAVGGMRGLVRLAGRRSHAAEVHAERVARYARILAQAWVDQGSADPALDAHWIDALEIAASVHDVGKVCVPEAILGKHGPLTPVERATMQRHAEVGADVLRAMFASELDFARLAVEVAESHHERWDGTGYPRRIAGERIPFAARLVAIADCYDALSSARPYKPAWPHAACVRTILAAAGTQFDPALAACFDRCQGEFERALAAMEVRLPVRAAS